MMYLESRPPQRGELSCCNAAPLAGVAIEFKTLLTLEPPGLRKVVAFHLLVIRSHRIHPYISA